jgi:hypothetical protein
MAVTRAGRYLAITLKTPGTGMLRNLYRAPLWKPVKERQGDKVLSTDWRHFLSQLSNARFGMTVGWQRIRNWGVLVCFYDIEGGACSDFC